MDSSTLMTRLCMVSNLILQEKQDVPDMKKDAWNLNQFG